MKYIIMCGGHYNAWETPRQLLPLWNETIVGRTIRLLRKNGIDDIAISTDNPLFKKCGVPILKHRNTFGKIGGGCWTTAFYPTKEPVCYIFGDVIFSNEAIKTIIETETDDIEFFASAPPFSPLYVKKHAEPFAFKVVNQKHFRQAIKRTEELFKLGRLRRCISWELWQVIKGTKLNEIDYTNFTVINDYTCDIDSESDANFLQSRLRQYQFLLQEEN